MQLVWRRRAPREIDHELLWLAVSLSVFLGGALWFSLRLPWPQCAFHSLTGFPCLTCGATRSAINFAHGNFPTALQWNPLAFLAYCALVVFDLYAIAVVITRRPRLRLGKMSPTGARFTRIALVSLVLANWIYLLSNWKKY